MIKKLCFSSLGILFFLMLVASVMKAQCPTDIAPTSIAWVNEGSQTYTSGGCTVTYYYCDRTVPDPLGVYSIYETYVYQVEDSSGCVGGPTSAIDMAIEGTFKNSTYRGNCNQLTKPKLSSYRNNCWAPVTYGWQACGNSSSYCKETCEICYSSGQIIKSNCSFSTIGTPPCSDPPGGHLPTPWTSGCYNIGCGTSEIH